MSSATSSPLLAARNRLPGSVAESMKQIASHVRAIAFWCAVLLPFVFISALQSGLLGDNVFIVFGLLVFNVICAIVGHGYAR